jgi:glycerol transport system ATP-binding protein
MNLMPCEVRGGEAVVAGLPVPTRNAAQWKGNGGRLEVGVRPEFVRFGAGGLPVEIVKLPMPAATASSTRRHGDLRIKLLVAEGATLPSSGAELTFDREHSNVYADGWIVN